MYFLLDLSSEILYWPNKGLKSDGEILGEATPLWLGIDRLGSGLCLVAFIKKPLCDDPVKG
jgi:hypothetical protein